MFKKCLCLFFALGLMIAALPAGDTLKPLPLEIAVPEGFEGDPADVIDGVFLEVGAAWDDPGTLRWEDDALHIAFDLGAVYEVTKIALQADNNDLYRVLVSEDGEDFRPLIDILPEFGEMDWGLDIFHMGPEGDCSQVELVFEPVRARYLRLRALEGDNLYSIAEFQVFGQSIE